MSESVELTESEKADLDSWAAAGVYLCGAADPCTGYHDQRPGHEHENLFDAVAELVAAREAAARREALLEYDRVVAMAREANAAAIKHWNRADKAEAKVARVEALAEEWANDQGILSPDSRYTRNVLVHELRTALAKPERDEEGRCTELTCPQHGPANRATEEGR